MNQSENKQLKSQLIRKHIQYKQSHLVNTTNQETHSINIIDHKAKLITEHNQLANTSNQKTEPIRKKNNQKKTTTKTTRQHNHSGKTHYTYNTTKILANTQFLG